MLRSRGVAVLGGFFFFFLCFHFGFFVFSHMQTSIAYLLLFGSGSFIYIAAADLIPIIKQEAGLRRSIMHFFIFLVGIALMMVIE